ncbi:NAD(P) transhydrogenase subunit alpha [Pantoea agglomerans]|nr:NAD(P) transhydrogenase subunit alpha [Pantoea agglomerans]
MRATPRRRAGSASINIFGGFTVTQRMLKMFRKG